MFKLIYYFFARFTISDWIQTISAFATVITLLITILNLIEIKKQYFEQNRGQIIFSIERLRNEALSHLIIKNYGNSSAKLIKIEISPVLNWDKTKLAMPNIYNITKSENVMLPPNKAIISRFDFRDYPDKEFTVKIEYETCNKKYIDEYNINLNYETFIVQTNPNITQTEQGLKEINNSIQQLSDKFL